MSRRGRALVGVVLALVVGIGAPDAGAVLITQHPMPAGSSPATAIFNGPNGLLVAEVTKNRIYDQVTVSPRFSVTPGPTGREASQFGLGPEGSTWLLTTTMEKEPSTGTVLPYPVLESIGPSGVVPRFKYSTPSGRPSTPINLAPGSDGAEWITDTEGNAIDRYAPDGQFKEYPLPRSAAYPVSIVTGPDGAEWFTNLGRGTIGRITTSGKITEYLLEDGHTQFGEWSAFGPYGLTVGPDQAFWFTSPEKGSIGRMTTNGQFQEFYVPSPGTGALPHPREIVTGREGFMWFTDPGDETIGRITINGEITEYPIPAGPVGPNAIVQAANGELVFTETNASALGSVNPNGAPTTSKPIKALMLRKSHCAKPGAAHGAHGHLARRGHRASGRTSVCVGKTTAQRHRHSH